MEQNSYIERLIFFGRLTYWKSPSFLRLLFKPLESIAVLFRHLRLDQWQLTGEESSSHCNLTIHYTGVRQNKNYFASLAFAPGYQEHYLGKRWFWQSLREMRKSSPSASLHIVEACSALHRIFCNQGCISIPSWLIGDTPIPDDILGFILKRKSLKYNYNKFSKNQYHPEVTSEASRIRRFYDEMHVPYIINAYGNEALVVDLNTLKGNASKCEVVLVKKGAADIAGALLTYKNNQVTFVVVGVQSGNYDHVRDGALNALDYFVLSYLQSKGYKSVNMGTSRPFLLDGALNAKKRWNYKITGSSRTLFMAKASSISEGVSSFLKNNPFICKTKNGFFSLVFLGSEPLSPEKMRRIFRDNYLEGLSGVYACRLTADQPSLIEEVPSELAGKFTIIHIPDLTHLAFRSSFYSSASFQPSEQCL